jgi:hypothetical protein
MTELLAKIVDEHKLPCGDAEASNAVKADLARMNAKSVGKAPYPKRDVNMMRDQIETWVNEGGAGDDVRS